MPYIGEEVKIPFPKLLLKMSPLRSSFYQRKKNRISTVGNYHLLWSHFEASKSTSELLGLKKSRKKTSLIY